MEGARISTKMIFYTCIKRILDIIIGLIGTILLIPITIIVKIAYMLTGDFHPIFFIQERVGKNGKTFKIFKYRSMIWNAEAELKKLMKTNNKIRDEYTKYKKLSNDPRITKVGKFIRCYSIDETPQFINILIGNMSLIGNRPYLLSEKPFMGKYYKKIIQTKPGITGLWQVSGHNRMLFEERLILESSCQQCLTRDLNIFIDTFKTLFCGGNQ